MTNPEEIAKLNEGVEAWNQWRAHDSTTPDLSEVDFSGKDLSLADLHGADLRGVNFNGSNLSGANLREANLQGADLSGAKGGLRAEQLAGADLTGAILPEGLEKLFDSLQNVNNISESARKLFLAVLAACLYSWLTIATTTDVNLITNRASSPLPIIQTSIPIVGFYAVAPLLLLCVYFYLHFYLQKLWEELGSLPAILADGRPLHAKIDPWLLNDLVRSHLPKLNVDRPFLSYFQLWISVLLAWWVVPITMFLFWGRYLTRHERIGTAFHVALLMVSVTGALCLYRLAVATLRGAERKPFRWRGMLTSRRGYQTAGFAIAAGVLFGIVSWGAIMGVQWEVLSGSSLLTVSELSQLGMSPSDSPSRLTWKPRLWVPRLMAYLGYSPFANLAGAEISQKKSTWSKSDKDLDSVVGARLEGANLRHALASGAFLARANLNRADLCGADMSKTDLSSAELYGVDLDSAILYSADLNHAELDKAYLEFADLSSADLSGAKLRETDLYYANLRRAHLGGAHLEEANLRNADLSDADLRGANLNGAKLGSADLKGALLDDHSDLAWSTLWAKNLNLEAVKGALHWEYAFYDDDTLKALGLPSDHNAKLEEQRKQALQQK